MQKSLKHAQNEACDSKTTFSVAAGVCSCVGSYQLHVFHRFRIKFVVVHNECAKHVDDTGVIICYLAGCHRQTVAVSSTSGLAQSPLPYKVCMLEMTMIACYTINVEN